MKRFALVLLFVGGICACGSKDKPLDGDAAVADANGTIDADPNAIDAFLGPDARSLDADLTGCVAGKKQCDNGCDDDNDGYIDGEDPECSGAIDDDEGSFRTGIPGDNSDPTKQDCFFDGNSGTGGGDCQIHVCCILANDPDCPAEHNNPPFDPGSCATAVDQNCKMYCEGLVPPGCDCFGCCTVCDAQGCVDIYTNPAVAPNCDQGAIHDPNKCPVCTKNANCGSPCGGQTCVLCPGQDPSTLPPSCGGNGTCPGGLNTCTTTADCGSNEYCGNGCCIAVVN